MILCLCLNSLSISTTLTEDAGGESPVGAVRMNIANAYDGSKYGYTLESKEFIEILKNNPQSQLRSQISYYPIHLPLACLAIQT